MTGTANRLSELRQKSDLSQAALATVCGVTEQTVSRWERGTTAIPDETKLLLANTLAEALEIEVSVEYLMGWDRIPAGSGKAAA